MRNFHVAKYAALLGATEVGLGAMLHGLNIPFGGQFLSCNQGFILCRAVREAPTKRLQPASISNFAALFKTLSPAGKTLTPMLAISAQGFLFSIGCVLLGANFFGCLVGISLLSFWAFLQPLLIAYLFFGGQVFQAALRMFDFSEKYMPSLSWNNFLIILAGFVIIKLLACWSLCSLAFFSDKKSLGFIEKINSLNFSVTRKRKRPILLQPLFLLSFALTLFFLYYSESTKSEMIWVLLRPLALGGVAYFLSPWLRNYFRLEQLAADSQ